MRAIWKGAVSFGLVTVPVRLYSATENHDLRFHQVRRSDGSRIRYKRVAEADGEEVAYADIAKGYQAADGRTVVLDDSDLASLPVRGSKEIGVEKFVPADQIDPMYLDKSYYLEPDAAAVKPYALLREALRDADRMAVVTISVRTRASMAVLRVHDEVIALQTMLWPDEVRAADFDVLQDVPEPKAAETAMAAMLIDSMAGDFDPQDYEDDYQQAVEALVEAKLEGGETVRAPEPEEEGGEVVDLLAALQKSVDRAKSARGEAEEQIGEETDADDAAEATGDAAPDKAPKARGKRKARPSPDRDDAGATADSDDAETGADGEDGADEAGDASAKKSATKSTSPRRRASAKANRSSGRKAG